MIRKPLIVGIALASTILLQGCANTTHVINLAPEANIESQQRTNTHPIKVNVSGFDGSAIGSIDTGIGEHADITIANNVSVALYQSIQSSLTQLGFTPSQGRAPSTSITYTIEELSYTTKTLSLKTEAKLVNDIKVTVEKGAKTYTANFKSEKIDQYGSLPDREDVEQEINDLVGKTVARSLEDPTILDMLSN